MFWAAGLASMLMAFFTTKLAIGLSFGFGVPDMPNERSSLFEPTPRLGGLGILAPADLTYVGFVLLGTFGVLPYPTASPEKLAMLGAGCSRSE